MDFKKWVLSFHCLLNHYFPVPSLKREKKVASRQALCIRLVFLTRHSDVKRSQQLRAQWLLQKYRACLGRVTYCGLSIVAFSEREFSSEW